MANPSRWIAFLFASIFLMAEDNTVHARTCSAENPVIDGQRVDPMTCDDWWPQILTVQSKKGKTLADPMYYYTERSCKEAAAIARKRFKKAVVACENADKDQEGEEGEIEEGDFSGVVFFSKDRCFSCDRLGKYLTDKNIAHTEIKIDATDEDTRNMLMELFPTVETVPQLFINRKLIGGYEESVVYFNEKITP